MQRYFLYARKSHEEKNRQILSIPSQVDELRELAIRQQTPSLEELRESQSAKEPGRPIFNTMMKQLQTGNAAGVIVWKLDRLARNPVDAGAVIWAVKHYGIRVITPQQTFSRDDEASMLLMYIEFGVAQKYIDDLSRVVKRGLKKKATEQKMKPGYTLLGYLNGTDKDNRHVIISDPQRFSLLQRALRLVLTGTSVRASWETLNGWGFLTRNNQREKGKPLSLAGFYRILTDPFYSGEFEYPRGSGDWYEGAHEHMITREEYNGDDRLSSGKSTDMPDADAGDVRKIPLGLAALFQEGSQI